MFPGAKFILLAICILIKLSSVLFQQDADNNLAIYLTWKSHDSLPEEMQSNIVKWRSLNPNHIIHVHDDQEARSVIRSVEPEFESFFETLVTRVVLADVYRLCVLYARGGLYTDFDVTPIAPINNWSGSTYGNHMVVGTDYGKDLDSKYKKKAGYYFEWQVGNFIMYASKRHHPVLKCSIETALSRVRSLTERGITRFKQLREKDIQWATGPNVITTCVDAHVKNDTDGVLTVLDRCKFAYNPISQWCSGRESEAVALHYHRFTGR